MSKNRNIFLQKICNRQSLIVFMGLLGLGCIIGGPFIKIEVLKTIVSSIGQLLLVGVLFNFMVKAPVFLEAVKEELVDIIYGKQFLSNQKDISTYWKIVSKQMFQNKFEDIHEDFLKAINSYLPKDEVSYYSEYEMYSKMEWENEAENMVKVVDEVKFNLIAETTDEFEYPLKNWIHVGKADVKSSKIKSFIINKVDQQIPTATISITEGLRCEEHRFRFSGSKNYEVSYVMEKIFNFNEDHTKGFKAKYIVKNCRVSFECPENIIPQFEARGTMKDFEPVSRNLSSNRIEKKYRGILLPQQGFIIALQKINKKKQNKH